MGKTAKGYLRAGIERHYTVLRDAMLGTGVGGVEELSAAGPQ